MTKSRRIHAAILVAALGSLGMGCELIAKVDRAEIPPTGAGGAGEGGTAGMGGMGGKGGAGGAGGTGGTACVPEDDNNECTEDVCNADGTTAHNPTPAGSVCSTGGTQCDGNGACVECIGPSDCPGQDNECQTRTCTQGACGFDYAATGTASPTQVAGDCKISVCDGAGALIDQNDDVDVPVDNNTCTGDVCTAGAPSNPVLPLGTNCGTTPGGDPLLCDDAGQCVGCNVGTDCPGTDDECKVRTCVNKTCGVSYTAQGTAVAAQTPNDCLSQVCDGNGAIVASPDDADVPVDDGNACTDEQCAAGVPIHPDKNNGTACNDGDACSMTDVCMAGACTGTNPVSCMAQDQCHVPGVCDSATGMCSNPPAMDGTSCSDNDACTQTDACMAGACMGMNPVSCMAQDQCHVAGVCNSATGMCSNPPAMDGTTCSDGDACTQTDACQAGTCTGSNPVTCAALDQCHKAGVCDGATGMCSNPNATDGTSCSDGNACTLMDSCQTGICAAGTPVTCMAQDQCHVAGVCDTGTGMCSNPNAMDGTACTSGSLNGSCTMGTCFVCGDGQKAATEGCDDGNTTNNDGCTSTCTVEVGYTCTGTAPSVCTPTCGDGTVLGTEQCDDGNMTASDGCTLCKLSETEVNNTAPTANPLPFTGNVGSLYGAIPAGADVDYYSFTVTAVSSVRIQTFDGSGNNTCTGPTSQDTKVFLYAPNGTTELANNDDGGTGITPCSLVDPAATVAATKLAPGTYYVKVQHWNLSAVIGSYRLVVTTYACGNGTKDPGENCDDGNTTSGDGCSSVCGVEAPNTETEANNTCVTANGPYALGGVGSSTLIGANITPAADQDWFSFTTSAYTDLKFETFDSNGPGSCATIDTVIQLYKSDCTTIQTASQDNGALGLCSRLDPAINAGVQHLSPGTYVLKANAFSAAATFAYDVQATVMASCGNGTKEGSEQCDGTAGCGADCLLLPVCGDNFLSAGEQCDDGNTTAADGCSATCQWETTAEVDPNGTTAEADVALPAITGNANITGAINPTLDLDLYKVVVPALSVVRFETFDPSGRDCTAVAIPTAMKLTLLDSAGVQLKQDTVSAGIGLCSELTTLLGAGTYYIKVEKSAGGTIPAYFLQVRFQAPNGSELEPNDQQNKATPMPGRDVYSLGDHTVSTDTDWYQLTLPGQMSLRIETIEGDLPSGPAPYNETCESLGIDSTIELLNSAGVSLGIDGDTGRGYCSQIDGTGATPSNAFAKNLAAGTYYIKVTSYTTAATAGNQFKYNLAVVAR